MNILQINYTDTPGRRFNGYDLHLELNNFNINSKYLVAKKEGNDNSTFSVISEYSERIRWQIIEAEKRLSFQASIDPYFEKIVNSDYFLEADFLHFHIWYFYFLSINNFNNLTKLKRSIWTIHDIWPFTGHCVAKGECDKWRYGCIECPNKSEFFPMDIDRANYMWKIKKDIFSKTDVDIVVSSDYMLNLLKESPIFEGQKKIHKIPFGLDLTVFKPKDKLTSRKKLLINSDDFVISFRAINTPYKGIIQTKEMLRMLSPNKNITLLLCQDKGLFDEFNDKYNIIEVGWIDDDELMTDFYGASDVFLMPSIEETFGLMAIEALACGRPIIVFEGTALSSVTFAPKCGISVKKYDSLGLKNEIEKLMSNQEECYERGVIGRKLAEQYYDIKDYYRRHIDLYKSLSPK